MKNTNSSGFTAETRKKRTLSREVRRQVRYMVGGVVLGFLLPYATVYGGAAPFGIGLTAAASGPGSVLIGLSAFAGYLVQGDTLRYMAALVTVAGIRWAVGGFKWICRSRVFPSVVAFLGTVLTGSALLLGETPSLLEVFTIFSEGVLAGGFAFFASTVFHELTEDGTAFSQEAEVCLIVMLAVAMMALFSIEFGGIAPARILAMIIVLLAARTAGRSGGGTVGIVMGSALLLSTPQYAFLAPAYALGGLLAGVFSIHGKWVSTVMMLASTGIVTALCEREDQVILTFYETASACLIFLVLPPLAESTYERLFRTTKQLPEVRSARQAVAMKMDQAARAIAEVAGTVDDVSAQLAGLGAPSVGSVYQAASDEVCRSCKSRLTCWQEHYADTMDSLNHLSPLLDQGGSVTEEQFDGRLARYCGRLSELTARINAGYREYLVREGAFRRLGELRAVVTDQFSSASQMLSEFSETLSRPEWTDAETARQIRELLEKQNIRTQQVVCRINDRGRMEVEILLDGKYRTQHREKFCRRIGEVCGRSFSLPIIDYTDHVTRIAFTEEYAFRVAVGTAQLKSEGEQLCGDAFECFEDGTGRFLAVLSDGMGSGGRAAVDGAMAARLSARLLKAGFGKESMLRLVNTALMAKSEDESLATLDIAVLNLFTGELELLKAGAGVSLLYSKGRVSRFDESSLPLGILRDITFADTHDRLTEGDVLVLMSDGVSDDGVEWVEDLLRDYDRNVGGMQGLAQLIADTARDRQPKEKSDDVTVIALGIHQLH